ncbi:hypothetical protein PVAP13_3NG212700 [Panicum virgatum]|uniref:Uncharacterized protein n=1 Tax=Panicum virgatum TaxID=38727 RepID=A0A8T0UF95_PANVG|nr:hypothetical protein PVAP13_3NG212700 [Panicum virgatum]KAG2620727.1 hypothetical protein PVAP13_3NG212700 [Panicum virgatum]KAG2620728.1 hypothetical protein PVAP13_3NG212700 [Panicum virgatum]
MVDTVGAVTKVIEVALKINKAADTAKQNEVCQQIKDSVDIVSKTLSQHKNNTELMNDLAVAAALEALDETLGEALKLVMECQQESRFVCLRLYTAGNLSQQLIKAEQRISSKNMDAMFAIMGFLLPKEFNQDNSDTPSRQVSEDDSATSNSEWDSSMVALWSCCAVVKKRKVGTSYIDDIDQWYNK